MKDKDHDKLMSLRHSGESIGDVVSRVLGTDTETYSEIDSLRDRIVAAANKRVADRARVIWEQAIDKQKREMAAMGLERVE